MLKWTVEQEINLVNVTPEFERRLAIMSQPEVVSLLKDIQHGIERESLRINPNGSLAQTDHPSSLGAALTHHFITTDFSESLLEFITPPERDTKKTMAQLFDIHKFVQQNIGDERLWPMSMPCFISNEEDIRLAHYGTSNVGKMKTLYRQGLKNRYGSMMQAIAGIHFNFSMPCNFWLPWLRETENKRDHQDAISDAYFGLVRNYRRVCWLIPYLFGASPALCSSFLGNNASAMPFEKLGSGSLYLPHATSLRMSDLGYTNSAQSELQICYNRVDSYVASLRAAISTPSSEFQKYAGKVDGQFQQLNANVLQIENELYSPIRPKQPTRSLEKPTDALADRGVSYIEVRALDVNPFSPVGLDVSQIHFLDIFLLHCLVTPGNQMTPQEFAESDNNIKVTVEEGRKPGVTLTRGGDKVSLRDWALELMREMEPIAELLDKANGCNDYSSALAQENSKVLDPELTFSASLLNRLDAENLDNGQFALMLAQEHKEALMKSEYEIHSNNFFQQQCELSWEMQSQIEANDKIDFDQFMAEQFGS